MEFNVKTNQLKKIISSTSKIVPLKVIQPILNNILFILEKGQLTIFSTDLELSIQCKMAASYKEKETFKIALPAKKIEEIVSKLPGEEVYFSIDELTKLTKISSEKAKFQISGIDGNDFPYEDIGTGKVKESVSLEVDIFSKALSLTSFASANFIGIQSVLSGLLFKFSNDSIEFVGADGTKLAICSFKSNQKIKNYQTIIPSKAVLELERLISNFKETSPSINIEFLENNEVLFMTNDFKLITRIINGEYPKYDNILPKDLNYKLSFNRIHLINSLERVSVMSNENTNVVVMNLEKNTNMAKFSASSALYGESKEEVEVNYSGDEIIFAFNSKVLIDCLKKIDEENITFKLQESLKPMILNLNEKELDYTFLIMPFNLR